MSKHRFYIDNPLEPGNEITLASKAHYIIHVLRLNVGDNIRIFNGHGHEHTANITKINKNNVSIGLFDDKIGFSLIGYTRNIKQTEMDEFF